MLIQLNTGLESPLELSREIARVLQNDPIAARQVREHIANDLLIDLLEIEAPHTADIETALDNCDCSREDIEEFCKKEYPLREYSDAEILEEAQRRSVFTDKDIMAEVKERWTEREFTKEMVW